MEKLKVGDQVRILTYSYAEKKMTKLFEETGISAFKPKRKFLLGIAKWSWKKERKKIHTIVKSDPHSLTVCLSNDYYFARVCIRKIRKGEEK